MTYWDPLPALAALPADSPYAGARWDGLWEERNRLNVPGPFYGAMTDTCLTGRQLAPDLVLYDDVYGQEFVYRQPRDPGEVADLRAAASEEACNGYGHDGDLYWTPERLRDWWRERGQVREWAVGAGWGDWVTRPSDWMNDAAAGARAYVAYMDHGLGDYLRGYLFRQEEGRPARAGEALPVL
ncbi:ferredoxin [Streptomyces sp. TBY4]|uniref:ferredoxin n=1 Tax=Streptomyces sp. TBY4 TaxID=2962030 RepID=UPI0020B71B44|nr:ferredoxin [Streptomyces sp. TBY4]MCP3756433.1 ferredoxin [Streptomyces sp. TBY4]